MDENTHELTDDTWKRSLVSQMIASMTATPGDQAEAYSRIGNYYINQAPATLFKYYYGIHLNIDSIESGKMWFSAPCEFNDVFDCRIAVNRDAFFNSAIAKSPVPIKKGSPAWIGLRAQIQSVANELERQFSILRQTIGVSCFSETYDSLLMWSHYANKHRGFCAEYNILEINHQLSFTAAPVLYSMDSTELSSVEQTENNSSVLDVFVRSLFTKALVWNYEREWRIIRDRSACGDNWDDNHKGALLDMIKPTSLILGCEAANELQERLRLYCITNKVSLYRMEKDPARFELTPRCLLNFGGNTLHQY